MPSPGSAAPDAGGGWPHRLALFTSCATLLLIVAGALVTSLGAGLAVPDWPTTFGHNMFTFPLSKMVGGILAEHSHRLLGSLVGFLTILTAGALLWRDERRWMRALGVAALGLVLIQGVLGGMRVVLVKIDLAVVHACAAQIFFGLMVGIALFTSRAWTRREAGGDPISARPQLVRLAGLAVGALYVQTALGAYLRHTGGQAEAHLLFAVIAAGAVLWAAAWAIRECGGHPEVLRAVHLSWVLLLVQLLLGVGAFIAKYTPWGAPLSKGFTVALTAAHVAVGSLLLAACLALAIWLRRFLAASPAPARGGALPGQATA